MTGIKVEKALINKCKILFMYIAYNKMKSKVHKKIITPILAIKIDDGNYSHVGVYVILTDILSRGGRNLNIYNIRVYVYIYNFLIYINNIYTSDSDSIASRVIGLRRTANKKQKQLLDSPGPTQNK